MKDPAMKNPDYITEDGVCIFCGHEAETCSCSDSTFCNCCCLPLKECICMEDANEM